MNYLAHAYLAMSSDEFLVGSFIGDFVKGSATERFSSPLASGILFHRRVDAFADNHEMSRASRGLFDPQYRRYAGVILDICYDHFLAKHWSVYADADLSEFITRVYETLQQHRDLLPAGFQAVLPKMMAQNWLGCYRSLGGVELTLRRISRRLRRPNALDESMGDIHKNYRELERNFHDFFKDLVDFAESFRGGDEAQKPPRTAGTGAGPHRIGRLA